MCCSPRVEFVILVESAYDVSSDETDPVELNPSAEAAMQELHIDISSQRSKSMDEFTDKAIDHLITVCNRAKDHALVGLIRGVWCIGVSMI